MHDSLTCTLRQLCVSVCEHVETKWQTTRALGKLTELGKSTGDSGEPKAACCCLSRPLWKAACMQLDTEGKGLRFPIISQVKKKAL